MRLIFIQIVLFLLLGNASHGQIVFNGFDQPVCSSQMTNTYSYSNFTNGGSTPGSYYTGYSILKNGSVVFTSSGNMGNQQTCEHLVFVNDSVGFSVIRYGTWSTQVFRTSNSGQNWTLVKFAPIVNFLALYPVNENHAFLIAENQNSPIGLSIYDCTDSPITTDTLLYDPVLNTDISITDSSITTSLCQTDSIVFSIIDTFSNTINYTIHFFVTRSNFNPTVGLIYPNPSSNELTIMGENVVQFELLNMQGEIIRTFLSNKGSLDKIPSGLYIVRVKRSDNKFFYNRLLKY